jgi:hypothetical protein
MYLMVLNQMKIMSESKDVYACNVCNREVDRCQW